MNEVFNDSYVVCGGDFKNFEAIVLKDHRVSCPDEASKTKLLTDAKSYFDAKANTKEAKKPE